MIISRSLAVDLARRRIRGCVLAPNGDQRANGGALGEGEMSGGPIEPSGKKKHKGPYTLTLVSPRKGHDRDKLIKPQAGEAMIIVQTTKHPELFLAI